MNLKQGLKFVALILIVIWFGLFAQRKPWQGFFSPEKKLELLWALDYQVLKKSKTLPQGFTQLKEIEIHTSSEKVKNFLSQYKHPDFGETPSGKYRLEIFLDETETGEIMIQYDLVDPNGNTVWELGRTLLPQKI